jgi:hypothetical protein
MQNRVCALVLLLLVAACGGKVSGGGSSGGSSSGSGGSGGSSSGSSGAANECFETSGSSQACLECVESACASQLAAAESGCSDLINCECPGGVFSESAAAMCTAQAQEPSCTNAVPAIENCEEQLCESACIASGSSSGGSSSGGSTGGSSSGSPPGDCVDDAAIACSGGASGYACSVGENPEDLDPELSCSTPTADADGEDDFCCFTGFVSNPGSCVADDDLTSTCPNPDSYGYQCVSGDDPTTLDPSLNCSTATPDPDGVHDDFCCTFG